MIFAPFSEVDVVMARAVMPTGHLSAVQHHVLDALRANAAGPAQRRPDGSIWRSVTSAAADIDGASPRRLALHFAALRAAGVFEPAGVTGGVVMVAAAKVRA